MSSSGALPSRTADRCTLEGPPPCARSSTLSSTSSVATAPSGSYHTAFRRGRPSTTTSGSGASTEPGSGCTLPCAKERGYDGGKKVKGRKRHLLVDTRGLVLKAKVHAASVMDRDGIKPLLERAKERFPRRKAIAAAGLQGAAETMDRRADVLVDRPEPPDEQRLRAVAGDGRGVRLCGDEPPDGEALGSLVRLFR